MLLRLGQPFVDIVADGLIADPVLILFQSGRIDNPGNMA